MDTLRKVEIKESGEPLLRPRRFIESKDLLGNDSEILILHGTQEYRLKLTSQGKLILTK